MAIPTNLTEADLPLLVNNIPHLAEKDASNKVVLPSGTYIKNASGLWVPVSSTNPMPTTLSGSDAQSYEALTIGSTAVALTPAVYGSAKRALITVETAQIRFRFDGTAPTSAEGHIADPGDIIYLTSNADIAAFRAIRSTSVDAKIRCTYSS